MAWIILIGVIVLGVLYSLRSKGRTTNKKIWVSLTAINEEEMGTFIPDFVVMDFETTGLYPRDLTISKKNIKEFDHLFPYIVQYSFLVCDRSGRYYNLKNYVNIPVEVPKDAIEIHGIDNGLLNEKGVDVSVLFEDAEKISKLTDVIVGHNIDFDYKVLKIEHVRNNRHFPFTNHKKKDTMREYAKANGLPIQSKIGLQKLGRKILGNEYDVFLEEFEKNGFNSEHDAYFDSMITAFIFLYYQNFNHSPWE